MLLEKNLHFMFHRTDILPKLPTHELVITVEYQLNWVKIVDFLFIAYFWSSPNFIAHTWPIFYGIYMVPILFFRQVLVKMNDYGSTNPWIASSIFDFSHFCCPECDNKSQSKQDFVNHASNFHDGVGLSWVRNFNRLFFFLPAFSKYE